ncbi:acyltransferase [uncultured Brevundimonas sp.]|uniref:acyltransferase family protein n=1 Tax=uncultured Brevundimonas sp. TaxID=213418 RepID=UPI0025D9536F|nr:acyltransferase [uncultured Brevundimonas sp.]
MKSTANTDEDFPALTSLRGLAALGVVLFHIDVCLFYREMGTLLPKAASGLIANGYLWVDFFFILSGFVIHHAYRDRLASGPRWRSTVDYYRARFFRIYPLHLILTGVLVLTVVVAGALAPGLKDGSWDAFFKPSALLANLLMFHAMTPGAGLTWNIVSWSIAAEWWVYAVAPLLIPLLAGGGTKASWACMGLGCVILVSLYILIGRDTLDITYDWGVIRGLGGFLIGLGLYRISDAVQRQPGWMADAIAAMALLGLGWVMQTDANDLLAIAPFVLLVLVGTCREGLFHKFLRQRIPIYLGRISYSIYLVHGLVFMLFWFGAPALGLTFRHPAAAWGFALVFGGLTIGLAALTYRYIEQPGQRLGRQIALRNSGSLVRPQE